jgi:hypothetical protein
MEKHDRIRTSRDCDANVGTSGEHAITSEDFRHPFD